MDREKMLEKYIQFFNNFTDEQAKALLKRSKSDGEKFGKLASEAMGMIEKASNAEEKGECGKNGKNGN